MILPPLFLFLLLCSRVASDASIDDSKSAQLLVCKLIDLTKTDIEASDNNNCPSGKKVAVKIRIEPITKQNWKMHVVVEEKVKDNKLCLHFGNNLTLRFHKKDKVERTIAGVTDELDAKWIYQISIKPAEYNFSLTYSKDLFDIVATGSFNYSLEKENNNIDIKKFWEKVKLLDIHNATNAAGKSGSGLSTGAIVGIIAGALVGLALLILMIRYLLLRHRRVQGELALERAATEKKGMSSPSKTPTGNTPKRLSRDPHEITGTEITGFTTTAVNTGTGGPGRTAFTGQSTGATTPSIPTPVAQSPKN